MVRGTIGGVTPDTARILIVDDQEANVHLLEQVLREAGYTDLRAVTNPAAVLTLYAEYQPDLILLDLRMPGLDGFAVLAQLGTVIPPGTYLPILVLTADITREARQRALAAGAMDFLAKPFDLTEVLLRIRNLLATRSLHRQVQGQNLLLEGKVRERTAELEEARLEALERLARAAEYRDDNTGQHAQRVGRTAALLARELGLPAAEVEIVRRAAPLHDVGKIGIPDQILLKPGRLNHLLQPDRLTPVELEVMQRHSTIGADILSGSRSPLLRAAEEIALTHHERWDGTGYPHGLRGAAIPLRGRIVAVADVYDALRHERPYKRAWPHPEAVAEIEAQRGRQFDPGVVTAFLRVLDLVRGDDAVRPQPPGSRGAMSPPRMADRQPAT